jgi:hypothetical protein
MNLVNMSWNFSILLLSLTFLNLASAASLHGHRHHHSQEDTPKMANQHAQINSISFNLSPPIDETSKVQQEQRHPQGPPHHPRDLPRVEQRRNSEMEEIKETVAWMRRSLAIIALGLMLGAEMVD